MGVRVNKATLYFGLIWWMSWLVACGDAAVSDKKKSKSTKAAPSVIKSVPKKENLPELKPNEAPVELDIYQAKAKNIVSYFKAKAIDYRFFSASLDVDVTAQQMKLNVGGKVRMKKDAVFWMNSTYLGIEVMRLKLTRDSVFFINKYHRTSLVAPIKQMEKAMGFSVNLVDMQNLFLGQMILDEKNESAKKIDSLGVHLKQTDSYKIIRRLLLGGTSKQPIAVDLEDPKTFKTLKVNYLSYQKMGQRDIPEKLMLNFNNQQKLEIKIIKPMLEKEVDFPFPKELKGYKKL